MPPINQKVEIIDLPDTGKVSVLGTEKDFPLPSPTKISGKTPQEAAAAALGPTAPTLAKPLAVAPTTGDATIWNPNTGKKTTLSKLGLKIGDPLPKGFQLWTGGTATGEEAQQAIIAQAPTPAITPAPTISQDLAAAGLDEEPIEGELVEDETFKEITTDDEFKLPEFDSILESFGISKIIPSDFSQIKIAEQVALTERIKAINIEFDEKIRIQDKKNKNISAAMQAKLIKAGVSLDGTSFQSAVAGQVERNEQSLTSINNERERQRSIARANSQSSLVDIGKQERAEVFNAQIANINNLFKGIGLATNIMSVFDKRSQFERSQEQAAKEHLDKMLLDWSKFDQRERETNLGLLQDFLEQGLISVADEEDLAKLGRIEKLFGFEEGIFTDAAARGNQKRLMDMALKTAQTAQAEARTKEITELLPLKKRLTEAQISRTRALAAKAAANQTFTFGEFIKLRQESGEEKLDTGKEESRTSEQQDNLDKLESEYVATVREHIFLYDELLDKPLSDSAAAAFGVPKGTLGREVLGEIPKSREDILLEIFEAIGK